MIRCYCQAGEDTSPQVDKTLDQKRNKIKEVGHTVHNLYNCV